MKDLQKYSTLDTMVYEYINQANLPSAAFGRLWPIAVRGFKDLFRTTVGELVTRRLTVLPNKIVQLPADFDSLSKVGVLNQAGQLLYMVEDRNLSTYAAVDDNRVALNVGSVDATSNYENVFRNYYNGDAPMHLFGVPYGTQFVGSYKLKADEGVILLSSDTTASEVFIEYKCNPVANSDFKIQDDATDAIIAWLAWKDVAHVAPGRRSSPTVVAQRRRDYFLEKKRLSSRVNAAPVHLLAEIILRGNTLAAKF